MHLCDKKIFPIQQTVALFPNLINIKNPKISKHATLKTIPLIKSCKEAV